MDYAALIAAAIQVVGPVLGAQLASADKEEAIRILLASRDAAGKLQVPKLKQFVAELQPDSQLAGIKDDPRYRAQQLEGNQALDDIIQGGGLTLADRTALEQLRQRSAQGQSQNRAATAQEQARRGNLDSGAQLAMSLSAQQQDANSLAQADQSAAAQAQQRAYQAIAEKSRLAGEGLNRDFSQKARAAEAQDAINRGNTNIRNLGNQYNNNLTQQGYENELAKQRLLSGMDANIAGVKSGNAQQTQDTWAQGSKAVGQGVQAVGNSLSDSPTEAELADYRRWKASQGGV